jgi:hypothetical protein
MFKTTFITAAIVVFGSSVSAIAQTGEIKDENIKDTTYVFNAKAIVLKGNFIKQKMFSYYSVSRNSLTTTPSRKLFFLFS